MHILWPSLLPGLPSGALPEMRQRGDVAADTRTVNGVRACETCRETLNRVSIVPHRLTLDTFRIKKSHQIIAGMIVAAVRRSAAAVAAGPALVR